MSTNIHFVAVRDVKVVNTGRIAEQRESFEACQTPTEVTDVIVASEDRIQAYIDWVLTNSQDVEEPVYEQGDIFRERPPIGTKIYNFGKEHVKKFKEWIAESESEGYEIVTEAW